MQHSTLLHIQKNETKANEVAHIARDKPAVLILEGGDEIYDDPYHERKDTHFFTKLHKYVTGKAADCNYYTINTDYLFKNHLTINEYNADTDRATPLIRELVEKAMLYDTPKLDITKTAEQRAKAVDHIQQILSKQTALGFSQGGELIQEIVNAIDQHLHDKGFKKEERKSCLDYYSASTIGCAAKIVDKPHNAPQIHNVISDDAVLEYYAPQNLPTNQEKQQHANLSHRRVGNNIIMHGTPLSPDTDNTPRTYAMKVERSLSSGKPDYEIPAQYPIPDSKHIKNTVPKAGEKPNPEWVARMKYRDLFETHDIYLSANINRMARSDLRTYNFNPVSDIFWEGTKEFAAAAQQSCNNSDKGKPRAQIIDALEKKHLSLQGKATAMAKMHENIEQFSKDRQWIEQNTPPQPHASR